MVKELKETNVLENLIHNSNQMNAHKSFNFSKVIKKQLTWIQDPVTSKVTEHSMATANLKKKLGVGDKYHLSIKVHT